MAPKNEEVGTQGRIIPVSFVGGSAEGPVSGRQPPFNSFVFGSFSDGSSFQLHC